MDINNVERRGHNWDSLRNHRGVIIYLVCSKGGAASWQAKHEWAFGGWVELNYFLFHIVSNPFAGRFVSIADEKPHRFFCDTGGGGQVEQKVYPSCGTLNSSEQRACCTTIIMLLRSVAKSPSPLSRFALERTKDSLSSSWGARLMRSHGHSPSRSHELHTLSYRKLIRLTQRSSSHSVRFSSTHVKQPKIAGELVSIFVLLLWLHFSSGLYILHNWKLCAGCKQRGDHQHLRGVDREDHHEPSQTDTEQEGLHYWYGMLLLCVKKKIDLRTFYKRATKPISLHLGWSDLPWEQTDSWSQRARRMAAQRRQAFSLSYQQQW